MEFLFLETTGFLYGLKNKFWSPNLLIPIELALTNTGVVEISEGLHWLLKAELLLNC